MDLSGSMLTIRIWHLIKSIKYWDLNETNEKGVVKHTEAIVNFIVNSDIRRNPSDPHILELLVLLSI